MNNDIVQVATAKRHKVFLIESCPETLAKGKILLIQQYQSKIEICSFQSCEAAIERMRD